MTQHYNPEYSQFSETQMPELQISCILTFVFFTIRDQTMSQLIQSISSQPISICFSLISLRYKSEGSGFDYRWCRWNFSSTKSFWLHYGPGVDSASNRNYHHKYFLGGKGGQCIGLTTLPPSCADCLEIWESQPLGTLWTCAGS